MLKNKQKPYSFKCFSTLLDRSLNFLMEDTIYRRFKFAVHCWEKKVCLKTNKHRTVLNVCSRLLDRSLNYLMEDTENITIFKIICKRYRSSMAWMSHLAPGKNVRWKTNKTNALLSFLSLSLALYLSGQRVIGVLMHNKQKFLVLTRGQSYKTFYGFS